MVLCDFKSHEKHFNFVAHIKDMFTLPCSFYFSYWFQNSFLSQTFDTLTTMCLWLLWLFIWASLVGFLNQDVHLLSQIWEVFRHLFLLNKIFCLFFSTDFIVHILICFMTYQSPLSLLQIFSFFMFLLCLDNFQWPVFNSADLLFCYSKGILNFLVKFSVLLFFSFTSWYLSWSFFKILYFFVEILPIHALFWVDTVDYLY